MSDIAAADAIRLGNVFGRTFEILGRRFLPIVFLTVIAQLPNWVVTGLTLVPGLGSATALGLQLLQLLVALVSGALASGILTYGIVQELSGRRFSTAQSLRAALRRLLPMTGVTVCFALAAAVGLMLLVVPGIMVMLMFYVAVPACVAERTGVFASLSRSRALTRGYRWQLFGFSILVVIGFVLVFMILGAIAAVALPAIGAATLQAHMMLVAIITLVVLSILTILAWSFFGVFANVFYYQTRIAKEGVSIDKLASVFD